MKIQDFSSLVLETIAAIELLAFYALKIHLVPIPLSQMHRVIQEELENSKVFGHCLSCMVSDHVVLCSELSRYITVGAISVSQVCWPTIGHCCHCILLEFFAQCGMYVLDPNVFSISSLPPPQLKKITELDKTR